MRCPHCGIGMNLNISTTEAWKNDPEDDSGDSHALAYGHCPDCHKLIVFLKTGQPSVQYDDDDEFVDRFYSNSGVYIGRWLFDDNDDDTVNQLIYPPNALRPVAPEVPKQIKQDFTEAASVLNISPKSSAALSRRILQHILHEHFNISKSSLAAEIEEFIARNDVPPYLKKEIDAVRNIGNFAAHPLKDTHTGSIVDVEPGEAEWLLDVLESLFDFAFVQPARHQEKVEKLNSKLKAFGKPPMKKPKS